MLGESRTGKDWLSKKDGRREKPPPRARMVESEYPDWGSLNVGFWGGLPFGFAPFLAGGIMKMRRPLHLFHMGEVILRTENHNKKSQYSSSLKIRS